MVKLRLLISISWVNIQDEPRRAKRINTFASYVSSNPYLPSSQHSFQEYLFIGKVYNLYDIRHIAYKIPVIKKHI